MQFDDPGAITERDKLAVLLNFEEFTANYKNGTKYETFMTPQITNAKKEDESDRTGAKVTL